MSLVVTTCDEARWATVRDGWRLLQQRSPSNCLFLDWDWITLWWRHFRRSSTETFVGITVHDGDELIGAVPMFVGAVVRRRVLRMRSAQCVGGRLDGTGGMLSEYLDVLAVEGRERDIRSAVLRELTEKHDCQEVVFCLSREFQSWQDVARGVTGHSLQRQTSMTSYQANVTLGFQSYLAGLSATARRSLYNLRRRLEKSGVVEHEIVPPPEYDSALADLNRLHQQRWGVPAFSGRVLEFHRELIHTPRLGTGIVLSRLLVGGKCLSVLYDIKLGTTQYNLQMGFDASFNRKVSPGLLHLGYAIEHASASGVDNYDFLGGPGRKDDYKRHIATQCQTLQSVQIVSGTWPNALLQVYDRCRRLARRE